MICTFRGVPFLPIDESASSGRRVQLSELPGTDVPVSADLGRLARRFKLTGAVNGEDPIAESASLLAALEESGPGTLVHPTLGVLSVVVLSYESSTSWSDERTVTITMDLAESGEAPEPQTDPVAAVSTAVAAVMDTAGAWYEDALDLIGGIAAVRTAVQDAALDLRRLTTEGPFASAIDDIESLASALDDIDGALVALVNAPGDYAAALVTAYESITDWKVLQLLLEPWGTPTAELSGSPSIQQQRDRDNAEEVRALNARMAIGSASLGLSRAARSGDLASRQAAMDALTVLRAALQAEIDTADPHNAEALLALDSAITADIIQAAQSLPDIELVQIDEMSDIVTLLHDRFGDLSRLDAHLAINNFINPLFTIGPVYLEVAP